MALTLLGRSSSISYPKVRLVFMSVTLVRCPVVCASPDIMVVVTTVFLRCR